MNNPTRFKLREAENFLVQMERLFKEDDNFYWNLSAFLSAARSITYYMQKQYKHKDGFEEWYKRQQSQMKADPELKYLNEARVEAVHTETVPTGATREVSVTVDTIVVEEGTEPRKLSGQAESVPVAQNESRTIRRFFPKFKNGDVMSFCRRQLSKLSQLVDDCENRST